MTGTIFAQLLRLFQSRGSAAAVGNMTLSAPASDRAELADFAPRVAACSGVEGKVEVLDDSAARQSCGAGPLPATGAATCNPLAELAASILDREAISSRQASPANSTGKYVQSTHDISLQQTSALDGRSAANEHGGGGHQLLAGIEQTEMCAALQHVDVGEPSLSAVEVRLDLG